MRSSPREENHLGSSSSGEEATPAKPSLRAGAEAASESLFGRAPPTPSCMRRSRRRDQRGPFWPPLLLPTDVVTPALLLALAALLTRANTTTVCERRAEP